MEGIDEIALSKACKGLIVVFIMGIIIVNSYLIFMIMRKGGFLYNPRSLTIISLAIGDIFLALFSLIVEAKIFYSDSDDITCQTLKSAYVYMAFFIHFLYALGLIVLALELVYRYKRQITFDNTHINIVKSVICSALPWFLGFIIVLPITMANTDENSAGLLNIRCLYITSQRYITMLGVTVVLPLCLAFISCTVVTCIRLMPVQYTNQVVGYEGSAQGVVIATHSAGNMSQQYPVSSVATASPYYNYDNNQNSKFESPGFNFPATQHPTQQQPNQHYPPPQNPIQQYPPPQYLPQQQTTQSNVIVSDPVYSGQPQTPVVSSFQDPRKEKKKLAVVSIVLFSCVLPITWYTMVIHDYGDSIYFQGTVDIILRSIFYWLSIFRSFITPIIWISSSRK